MSVVSIRHLMPAILGVVGLLVVWSLIRVSRSEKSKINLDDLLLDKDGTTSKSAIVFLGSWAMTTWVIVFLTLTEKLTELYFTAYITAWIVPVVTRFIKPQLELPK